MITKENVMSSMYRDFISKYFINNYDFRIEQNRDDFLQIDKFIRDNHLCICFFKDYFDISCYSNFDNSQLTSIAFYYKDYDTLQKITDLITELETFISIFNKYFNVNEAE